MLEFGRIASETKPRKWKKRWMKAGEPLQRPSHRGQLLLKSGSTPRRSRRIGCHDGAQGRSDVGVGAPWGAPWGEGRGLTGVGSLEGKSRLLGPESARRWAPGRLVHARFLQPLDADIAEGDGVAVASKAEEASGPFQAGMGAAAHECGRINRGEVAIEDGIAIQFHLDG
jgi:hypothetical protein